MFATKRQTSAVRIVFVGMVAFFSGGILFYSFAENESLYIKFGSISRYAKALPYVLNESQQNQVQMEDSNDSLKKQRVPIKVRERLGIVSYLPFDLGQVQHLIVMLFGSWKFIVDHQSEYFSGPEFDYINDVDLLVFCDSKVCSSIAHLCTVVEGLTEIKVTNGNSKCWAVEQPFEVDIPYNPLNSFIMFNRTDILELIPRYKYILRTDNDVFVTPAIYRLKPKIFLYGHGGYSDPFNIKRLRMIASRLGLKHRGVHNVGSTWCGETGLFIKAGRMTLNISRYMFVNEFDPKAKGLETIDFKKNPEGEWVRWWRPVSSMYGGELTMNHLIEDISSKNNGEFDTSSCDKISIWKTPHIHCWHNDCEFQKFRFITHLNSALYSRDKIPGDVVHHIIESTYLKDITKMSVKDYSRYIAWSSVQKYLKKWFLH